jgi:hypothetical protein
MTLTIKQHKNDKYYITMEHKNNCFIVQVCPLLKDNMAGYPIREMIYPISEKKNAQATFNRYKRTYIY